MRGKLDGVTQREEEERDEMLQGAFFHPYSSSISSCGKVLLDFVSLLSGLAVTAPAAKQPIIQSLRETVCECPVY